jgi:hypothetical protein
VHEENPLYSMHEKSAPSIWSVGRSASNDLHSTLWSVVGWSNHDSGEHRIMARYIDGLGGIVELALDCACNVLSWWRACSCATVEHGALWYQYAHNDAQSLALDFALPSTDHGAGIIAALSPLQAWSGNVEIARALLEDPLRSVHFAAQTDKALQIADGADWRDVLAGPKERSFAQNISHPQCPQTVTVDGFAAQIALGSLARDKEHASYLLRLAGVYTACADGYKIVARDCGVLPSTVQASTWLHWRQEHGISR